jgi:hypothetical protein
VNTTEALEAITDRGQFELLVTSVLRKANRDYAHILQTGINAAGEPVRSPVDGFCRAPESTPPRFLMVQATTSERRYLERKWLYDPATAPNASSASASDEGDLFKAGRLAQELTREFSDAKFTVILATNQRPDLGLLKKVYKKAENFNMICDIWDQSRLADFLDNTHEGHWLRKQYLGIEAEMLSESLLRTLCEQSLACYEKELFTNPDSCVSREVDENVEEGLHSNRYTIQFLIGESGFGKSTAAYRALQKHLESGGYGLWIPAELIKECLSLENAIEKVLRALYPHLLPGTGKTALQLIQEGSRFLIVVDDANRTEDPTKFIRKLLTWSKPQQSDTPDSQPSFSSYLVVCPVWPHVWGLTGHDFSKTSWVHTVFIELMTSAEGVLAVQAATSHAGIEITSTEANALATKMGNDPILIGLFSALLSNTKPCDLNMLAEDVVEKFITSGVKEAASALNSPYLSTEYREALSTISSHMLRKRRIHPFWKEIESWLEVDSDTLKALRELIRHGKLCRLTDQDQFAFRHDRVQEVLLVASMAAVLADTAWDNDILEEPFYAEIIGQALMRFKRNQVFLKEMRNRLPLALVEAIRYFGTPTSGYHRTIIEEVKEWAKNSVATGSVPDSVLDAVCWSLVETDSPAVLEITETFPPYPLVFLARLRNGCAASGARYCVGRHGLAPSITDNLRDRVLEQAKRHHREKLLRELKQLLKSPVNTDEVREGALALAGFLGFIDLQDDIATCWELVTDKKRVLPEAIWAATQCCSAEPNKFLDPLMADWAGLSGEEDSYGMPPKIRIAEARHFALARGIRDDVINYFIEQCNVHESLRWPITCMCDRIDAPDAIEFIVRSAADIERGIAGTDKFSPWTTTLADNWTGFRSGGRKLSQASLGRLRALWEDLNNDEFVKRQAFRLWLTDAEWEQIDILRAIPTNSPLFRSALWKRAQLGDQSILPNLLPILSTETPWFRVAHYVWCDEIMAAVQYHLEAFQDNIPADFSGGWLNAHYELSSLLMMIPVKDAETLLDKYWGHLGYSPLFIQTALYAGTPKCLELAASSISRCPRDVDILKHIHHQFGFMDSEREKYLTIQHLDNLLPYLDRLGEHELWQLAEVCQRLGIPEWSKQHISDRVSEKYRKQYHPSGDDLLQDLDDFATDSHGVWRVMYWLEEFDKRHDPKSRVLSIVDRWLASRPTAEGLKIAAACVQTIGTRKDLSILDKYAIEGPRDKVANIKESTRFFIHRRSLD